MTLVVRLLRDNDAISAPRPMITFALVMMMMMTSTMGDGDGSGNGGEGGRLCAKRSVLFCWPNVGSTAERLLPDIVAPNERRQCFPVASRLAPSLRPGSTTPPQHCLSVSRTHTHTHTHTHTSLLWMDGKRIPCAWDKTLPKLVAAVVFLCVFACVWSIGWDVLQNKHIFHGKFVIVEKTRFFFLGHLEKD